MQKEKKKWDKKMSKWKEKMPTKVLLFKYINLINCPGYWTLFSRKKTTKLKNSHNSAKTYDILIK